MKVDEKGVFKVPLSGKGPYTMGVYVGAAFHENHEVSLEPGDHYRFVFPQDKLSGRGSIVINVIGEDGKPFNEIHVALRSAGAGYFFAHWFEKPTMSLKFLKEGQYRITSEFPPHRQLATPEKVVTIKAGITEQVILKVSHAATVKGRLLSRGEDLSGVNVFLCGVSVEGDTFKLATISEKDGTFVFKRVPLGECQCRASGRHGVFGPEVFSINDFEDVYQVELRLKEESTPVEFMLHAAQGSEKKETNSLRFVEVMSEDGEEFYWKQSSYKVLPAPRYPDKTQRKGFIAYLSVGTYRVRYCVAPPELFKLRHRSAELHAQIRETLISVGKEPLVIQLQL